VKPESTDNRPRLAASSYLNTAPLIWSFMDGSQRESVELFTDTAPARCACDAGARRSGRALVPIIEYQRTPDIVIVPMSVSARKTAVRSVVLVTRKNNLEEGRASCSG
jgi:predicted solute-binding protein